MAPTPTLARVIETRKSCKGTQPEDHIQAIDCGQGVWVCKLPGAREACGHGLEDEGREREEALHMAR